MSSLKEKTVWSRHQTILRQFQQAFRGWKISFQASRTLNKIAPLLVLFVFGSGLVFGVFAAINPDLNYLKFQNWEWLLIIILIANVFRSESFNTSIEMLSDKVMNHRHGHANTYDDQIRDIKDIASGAVVIDNLLGILGALLIVFSHLCNFQWWTFLFS